MANPNQNQHGKLPTEQPDDKDRQRGGSGNFAQNRDRASEEGRKGGQNSGGGTGNPGNFGNDRDKASEAGRKGGESPQSGRTGNDR